MTNEKEDKKKHTLALFINTAQEMIEADGVENLSIRRIADKAGFHNSTIYLYFKDLDELLMLASIKYFQEYSIALASLGEKKNSSTENFLEIWSLFYNTIFKQPGIFYNFFFGKRSTDLQSILNKYYDIFPEERQVFSSEIEMMYFGNNLTERSFRILTPLIQDDTGVTKDNIEMLNDIIISSTKYLLEQKCKDESLDNNVLISKLMDIIHYICKL
ncbi:AcrR family transcriptional regulator [Aequitasia blattaphilus]|uniref:TetR/AcrR family transcriptional regulator n=1 Tax=Aequitasia blattaphilus TaxID=2949332 RepID=A0ABT1EB85_9FIRM|nr:TetR/AcrR family transcriptional regulator [Aequitasia blattaphilus]MCP1103090.1 TetR/AcrR family transcriptional regulator [Aequitasia blattaphilus]MCR8615730.1 TetR/AcrR family transcriptional regulator [Aequitasia blattaphilus]